MAIYLLHLDAQIMFDPEIKLMEAATDVLTGDPGNPRKAQEAAMRLLKARKYWAVAAIDKDRLPPRGRDIFESIRHHTQNGATSDSWSKDPPDGITPLGDGTVDGGLGYSSSNVGDLIVIDDEVYMARHEGFDHVGRMPVSIEALPAPFDNDKAALPGP